MSAESASAGAPRPPAGGPRRRALPRLVWWLLGAVVLVGLFFAVDGVVRRVAEDRLASTIEAELPDEVAGSVRVEIGGASVIAQYLTGRMERVRLTGDDLEVQGVPVRASVVLTGVPTAQGEPVSHVVATLGLDEAGLNEFVRVPGADGGFTIDDGTIGYAGTVDVLGLTLGYTASATAQAAGSEVLLTPVSASVDSGAGSIDLSGVVDRLVAEPLAVCVADRLPAGAALTGIDLGDGSAAVRIDARDLVLDEAALTTTGTC